MLASKATDFFEELSNNSTITSLSITDDIKLTHLENWKPQVVARLLAANKTLMNIKVNGATAAPLKHIIDRNKVLADLDWTSINRMIEHGHWEKLQELCESWQIKASDVIDSSKYSLQEFHQLLNRQHEQISGKVQKLENKKIKVDTSIKDLEVKLHKLKEDEVEVLRQLDNIRKELEELAICRQPLQVKYQKATITYQKEQSMCAALTKTLKEVADENDTLTQNLKIDLAAWSVVHVLILLKELKLHRYLSTFKRNHVCGGVLVHLTTLDFVQMGMSFKEAKSLIRAIYTIQKYKSLNSPDGVLTWRKK
jgi:hypothetical protein